MNCQKAQELLDAYADGELDLVNHLAIEEHLDTCRACSRVAEDLAAVRSAMTDSSLYFMAPAGLRGRISSALPNSAAESRASGPLWRWAPTVAAAAVVIALTLLFLSLGSSGDELIANEVVSSHVRSMMAEHLTDVPSSDQHTVKPWFDGKLDFSPPVVDLAAEGYPLIGGRLDYVASRPVAAIVYQRRQHFINLFVFPSTATSETGARVSVRQGYNLIHWSRSGMTFWAVSDLNLNELQDFAGGIQN